MATPSYEQILSFGSTRTQLVEYAIEEFQYWLKQDLTEDELFSIATQLGEKYGLLGSELGAQWYDLCTQLAEIEAEPAELSPVSTEDINARVTAAMSAEPGLIESVFNSYLQNVVNDSIRRTGDANLQRDYERGLAGGKWCRVPVGDTCAWCLMLASNGAWYKSKETALGTSPDHYHSDCNCVAVYHADAESVKGYEKLAKYKEMYYTADDMRIANNKGREKYPEELEKRVTAARVKFEAEEQAKYEEAKANGVYYNKKSWPKAKEDLIIMRYQYGLK